MGKSKECFVCGALVPLAGARFFDVEREDGSTRPREACSSCFYKAIKHQWIMASHNGKSYKCRPRSLQRDLYGRTFRELTRNGGRDV